MQQSTGKAAYSMPSTYIVCERDTTADVAPDVMSARATNVPHLVSDHMPLLSMPSALTDLIVEAADNYGLGQA